jgi:hypothetical protein
MTVLALQGQGIRAAIEGHENGYLLICSWLDKSLSLITRTPVKPYSDERIPGVITARINAGSQPMGITLHQCRRQMSLGLQQEVRLAVPRLPDDKDLYPWVAGYRRQEITDKENPSCVIGHEPSNVLEGMSLVGPAASWEEWNESWAEKFIRHRVMMGWRDAEFEKYVVEPVRKHAEEWRKLLNTLLGSAPTAEEPQKFPWIDVSDSGRSVNWSGRAEPFLFSPSQAKVILLLYSGLCSGHPDCDGARVRDEAEIASQEMRDVFRTSGKMHDAWDTMIVSRKRGTYRLAPPGAPAVIEESTVARKKPGKKPASRPRSSPR